jgi:hypothetical protein
LKKPPRAQRRLDERAARKLVRDRQKLALAEPGGAPERPIEVISSSVIPVRARATPCPLCAGSLNLDEEIALDARLRAAVMTCRRCGVSRRLYFTLPTTN